MEHAGFIVASYAAGVLCVAGLVAWVVADGATLRKRLSRLEDKR